MKESDRNNPQWPRTLEELRAALTEALAEDTDPQQRELTAADLRFFVSMLLLVQQKPRLSRCVYHKCATLTYYYLRRSGLVSWQADGYDEREAERLTDMLEEVKSEE